MTRFIDVYIPDEIPGYPCISSPRWYTDLQRVSSGAERANQEWESPIHTYTLPDAIRKHADIEGLHDHWMAMSGPAYTFPFRDPLDFASASLTRPNFVPTMSRVDQPLGTGDGATRNFQLKKQYTRGSRTTTRNIYHPVVSTILVGYNNVDPEVLSPGRFWSVDRLTGIVAFDEPPGSGAVLTWGGLFDVEVRFESDDAFDGVIETYGVSGVADVTLEEVRPC